MTPTPPPERRSRRQHARTLFDRVPTKLLLTGISAVLLSVSALAGGLDDAPVQAAPTIEAGDTHRGTELTITVDGAVLIDALPEQYMIPDDGNRLLVVRATVENTTTKPRRLSTVEADSLGVRGIPGTPAADPPHSIVVIDDGSERVVAQPGIPVEVAFVWEVAGDALAAGELVSVDLLDRVLISEGRLTYGGLYDDPVVSASLELPLGDVGSGASE